MNEYQINNKSKDKEREEEVIPVWQNHLTFWLDDNYKIGQSILNPKTE